MEVRHVTSGPRHLKPVLSSHFLFLRSICGNHRINWQKHVMGEPGSLGHCMEENSPGNSLIPLDSCGVLSHQDFGSLCYCNITYPVNTSSISILTFCLHVLPNTESDVVNLL